MPDVRSNRSRVPSTAVGGSARPARVLVVAPQPFYEDRGTPIAVRQVLEALSELEYDVDLVTYPVGSAIDIPRVRFFRAPNPLRIRHVPVGLSARKLLLDATLLSTLHTRLRAERYACIHAVEEAAFPAVVLGRRHGVPVIYDMQSSLPEHLARHAFFRAWPARTIVQRCEEWLLRRADWVVGSSGLAARVRELAPTTRVREWRFAALGPQTSPDSVAARRRELQIPSGAPVVLYSGTFEPYQGIPDLIAAIPTVLASCPAAVFVLVGASGAAGEAVRRQAADLEQQGAVRFVERQPRDRIPSYLAIADVLVSPRLEGGNLPLKIFDYLATGRPIVATDVLSHRAVLTDERAVLVKPTADALARGITEVLTDDERARRLGAAARAYADHEFAWPSFVESVRELYEEAVQDGAAQHAATA